MSAASATDKPYDISTKESRDVKTGDVDSGAFLSDVSIEGGSSVVGEDDKEEHDESDCEEDDGSIQGEVEFDNCESQDGYRTSEGEAEESSMENDAEDLEDAIAFQSGSEIALSSSEDEAPTDDELQRNFAATGDSASETYYDDEEDLRMVERHLSDENEAVARGSAFRVYESSDWESDDEEIMSSGDDAKKNFEKQIRTDEGLQEEDLEKVTGDLSRMRFRENEDDKGSRRKDNDRCKSDADAEEEVVRWDNGCSSSCTMRKELKQRLEAALKLLSEFQLLTAERAAEAGAASRNFKNVANKKGKNSEKMRLKMEVEQLRVTLDYLTRLSLANAVELQEKLARG